jgi:hypothetical protein
VRLRQETMLRIVLSDRSLCPGSPWPAFAFSCTVAICVVSHPLARRLGWKTVATFLGHFAGFLASHVSR